MVYMTKVHLCPCQFSIISGNTPVENKLFIILVNIVVGGSDFELFAWYQTLYEQKYLISNLKMYQMVSAQCLLTEIYHQLFNWINVCVISPHKNLQLALSGIRIKIVFTTNWITIGIQKTWYTHSVTRCIILC